MTSVNKKQATTSAEIVSDDLLLEILSRLPLYSIQRMKTACKNWQSLIANPTFRKQWRKRNLKLPIAIGFVPGDFYWGTIVTYLLPLSPNKATNLPHLRTDITVTQSCNGLLLGFSDWRMSTYRVYNPTTDTCHTLPKIDLQGLRKKQTMFLAFDPNRSLYYKVICFVKLADKVLRVYIYSSDTRTWRMVSKPFCSKYYGKSTVNGKGVYWNGAINWVKKKLYFNIENEGFKAMPEPSYLGDKKIHHYVGESCDRFNYIPHMQPMSGNTCSVNVYELKRDYSEWVLKYHVELDYQPFVFSLVHGVEEDDSFLLLHTTEEGIVRYNIVSETSEKVPVPFPDDIDNAFHYIETQSCV